MGRKDREFNDWTDSLETSLKNCIQCNTPSNKHLLKFSFISSPVKAKSGEQKPCHWKEKKKSLNIRITICIQNFPCKNGHSRQHIYSEMTSKDC